MVQEGTELIPGPTLQDTGHQGDEAPSHGSDFAALFGSASGYGRACCQEVGPVLSLVGDKWTVLVVTLLAPGPRRFNEIKRLIGGITQRMLTFTLRALERDGLVKRTAFPTVPPRVEYELTDLGHSLREPVEALGRWAFDHYPSMAEARHRFEAAARDRNG